MEYLLHVSCQCRWCARKNLLVSGYCKETQLPLWIFGSLDVPIFATHSTVLRSKMKDLLHCFQVLQQHVASRGYPTSDYELVTHFPRRNLSELKSSTPLESASLQTRDTVFVQAKSWFSQVSPEIVMLSSCVGSVLQRTKTLFVLRLPTRRSASPWFAVNCLASVHTSWFEIPSRVCR